MRIPSSLAICLVVLGAAFSGGASAALVSICGPNVCYDYDDAQLAVGLTGTPTRVGDSMQFVAENFRAQSSDNGGLVVVGGDDANFIFSRVYTANSLDEITSFTVSEEFDYRITNGGTVDAVLYTAATSNLLGWETDTTNATDDSFAASGDSGGRQISEIMTELYPGSAFSGPATDMQIVIRNTLSAYTGAAGELATIQKKFTLATNTILSSPVVPLPASLWLLGSAVGLLGVMRRRLL